MNVYYAIVGACWIAFLAAWGILAVAFGRSGRSHYSPMSVGARVVLLVVIFFGFRFGSRIPIDVSGVHAAKLAAAGSVLCVAGVAFATWGRVALGRNWGMPMTLHEDPELVTSGAYRYVRHPIYTGLTAMLIGTSLVYALAAFPSAAIIGYSLLSALREEHDMEKRFPEAYPEYKKRSKMFLPFLI